jgi:hypothetical protein
MAYNIIVSPRVQNKIENAIDYYLLYSVDAPKRFIEAYETLMLHGRITPYKTENVTKK